MTVGFSFLLFIACFLSGCSEKLSYPNVRSHEKCDCKKDAYWYNEKCWKNYEDEAISLDDIDSVVQAEMIQAESAVILIDGEEHPIDLFFPIPEGKEFIVLTEYSDSDGRKSMISEIPLKVMRKKEVQADVLIYRIPRRFASGSR